MGRRRVSYPRSRRLLPLRPLLLAILAVLFALFMAALPALAQPVEADISAGVTATREADVWTAVFHLREYDPALVFTDGAVALFTAL